MPDPMDCLSSSQSIKSDNMSKSITQEDVLCYIKAHNDGTLFCVETLTLLQYLSLLCQSMPIKTFTVCGPSTHYFTEKLLNYLKP